MGKRLGDWVTPAILDQVEIADIKALQVVNENSTQFGEDLVAERTPIVELNSSYGFTDLRYLTPDELEHRDTKDAKQPGCDMWGRLLRARCSGTAQSKLANSADWQ